jgi:hypothetical protein
MPGIVHESCITGASHFTWHAAQTWTKFLARMARSLNAKSIVLILGEWVETPVSVRVSKQKWLRMLVSAGVWCTPKKVIYFGWINRCEQYLD